MVKRIVPIIVFIIVVLLGWWWLTGGPEETQPIPSATHTTRSEIIPPDDPETHVERTRTVESDPTKERDELEALFDEVEEFDTQLDQINLDADLGSIE